MMNKRIVLIGAGNVAHHLAPALLKAGLNLCQIYSRSIESARALGMKTGMTYTAEISTVYPDGDIYIFCISDDSLSSVAKSIRINKNALLLHTSGSMPLEVFKSLGNQYGVLYPIQTFTKNRDLNFSEIPLCIEASNATVLKELRSIAHLLSNQVCEIGSEKRKHLHLAAIFANNFTNHLYGIAGKLLESEGLDFTLLRPLIFETAHKVMLMTPEQAQTGPARRDDEEILGMHKAILKDQKKLLSLYSVLSDSIRETNIKPEIKEEADNKQMMLTLW